MSFEYLIEENVSSYLRSNLSDIYVDALGNTNYNEEGLIKEAQKRPKGYVVVHHIRGNADSYLPEKKRYKVIETFVFTLFSKNRNERSGIYDLVDDVRKLIITYAYGSQKFIYKNHMIHPQPIDNGLYIAELEFEIIQYLSF